MDACGTRLNLDPVELRRRKLVQPDQFSYAPHDGRAGKVEHARDYEDMPEPRDGSHRYAGWRKRQVECGSLGGSLGIAFRADMESGHGRSVI